MHLDNLTTDNIDILSDTGGRFSGPLTCQVLEAVPELFDARVGNHAVLAVHQIPLVVGELLAESFSLPQAGVELLVNP